MEAYDLRIEDNDLYINPNTGDFQIAYSDPQHIQDIIESFAGWWKEFPALGVGIKQYQGSSGMEQTLQRSIKLQLQGDGYSVEGMIVESNPDGTFTIYPNAVR